MNIYSIYFVDVATSIFNLLVSVINLEIFKKNKNKSLRHTNELYIFQGLFSN